jgi:hypothetical protein
MTYRGSLFGILSQLCRSRPLPTERAESQRSSAMDSLRLFPRRLCCRQRAGCCSLSHLDIALVAWRASASGSLSSQICTLSQLERASGFMATSLAAEARGASVACARGVCAALGGRQRACGMKLARGSGKGLRLMHGSGTREQPRWPSLPCRGLSCACCYVLGNDLSGRASCARPSALSWGEGRQRPVAPSVVDEEEGDKRCNCERS